MQLAMALSPERALLVFLGLALLWMFFAYRAVVMEPISKRPTGQAPQRSSGPCPATTYTAAEVQAHSKCMFAQGEFDVWLVIDGQVYDVTDWAPRHPGGAMLCAGSGKDASKLFAASHSPHVREADLPKWCIGRLAPGEVLEVV